MCVRVKHFRLLPIHVFQVQPVDPLKGDFVNCVCKEPAGGCGTCTTTQTKHIVLRDSKYENGN